MSGYLFIYLFFNFILWKLINSMTAHWKYLIKGVVRRYNGNFTNQNATQPETSPEVICSQNASLRMLGAKLQRVFFTFRTRGWHLQRFQKTWVVSTEFDLELNFLLLPYRQNCFSKSMKMLFIVKKYQTNILICLLLQVNWLQLWWMDNTQTRRVRYQSRKLASKSNLVY